MRRSGSRLAGASVAQPASPARASRTSCRSMRSAGVTRASGATSAPPRAHTRTPCATPQLSYSTTRTTDFTPRQVDARPRPPGVWPSLGIAVSWDVLDVVERTRHPELRRDAGLLWAQGSHLRRCNKPSPLTEVSLTAWHLDRMLFVTPALRCGPCVPQHNALLKFSPHSKSY